MRKLSCYIRHDISFSLILYIDDTRGYTTRDIYALAENEDLGRQTFLSFFQRASEMLAFEKFFFQTRLCASQRFKRKSRWFLIKSSR